MPNILICNIHVTCNIHGNIHGNIHSNINQYLGSFLGGPMATWHPRFCKKGQHMIAVLIGFHLAVCCLNCCEGKCHFPSITAKHEYSVLLVGVTVSAFH